MFILGLIMFENSIYAVDAGIGCKTSRNVAEATISTPDEWVMKLIQCLL